LTSSQQARPRATETSPKSSESDRRRRGEQRRRRKDLEEQLRAAERAARSRRESDRADRAAAEARRIWPGPSRRRRARSRLSLLPPLRARTTSPGTGSRPAPRRSSAGTISGCRRASAVRARRRRAHGGSTRSGDVVAHVVPARRSSSTVKMAPAGARVPGVTTSSGGPEIDEGVRGDDRVERAVMVAQVRGQLTLDQLVVDVSGGPARASSDRSAPTKRRRMARRAGRTTRCRILRPSREAPGAPSPSPPSIAATSAGAHTDLRAWRRSWRRLSNVLSMNASDARGGTSRLGCGGMCGRRVVGSSRSHPPASTACRPRRA
jgi:hypothetical protein